MDLSPLSGCSRSFILIKPRGLTKYSIHSPPSTSSVDKRSYDAPSILVSLPSGTSLPNTPTKEALSPSQLVEATSLPVVHINYRLSPAHLFPTSIHDVVAGYDWIVKNLLPSPTSAPQVDGSFRGRASSDPIPTTAQQSRIGVYGTHIGGSLALSLGLTECRTPTSLASLSEHPARVVAIATQDAITDWAQLVPLKELALKQSLQSQSRELDIGHAGTMSAMEKFRQSYFHDRRLDDCLDPFASPALFFRTAGIELPLRPYGYSAKGSSSSSQSSTESTASDSGSETDAKAPRYYHRRFPPASMGPAILPAMQLSVCRESRFEKQNLEFVRLVQRALVRQAMPKGTGQKAVDEEIDEIAKAEEKRERDETIDAAKQIAEERFQYSVEGHGYEDDVRAGEWLRRSLAEVD